MIIRSRTATGDIVTEIELPNTPFKLLVSGGFDSALLLYLFSTISKEQKKSIDVALVDRGNGSIEFGKSVCNWVNDKVGISVNIEIINLKPNLNHKYHVSESAKFLHERGFITVSADTQNPKGEEFPGTAPIRILPYTRYEKWIFPFGHLDKSHTVFIAKQFNILREISVITHTCTETSNIRCTRCWQCSERRWAFDLLNIVDLGQY